MEDLWSEEGVWHDEGQIHGLGRISRTSSPRTLKPLLDYLRTSLGHSKVLHSSKLEGWSWQLGAQSIRGWRLKMEQWREILLGQEADSSHLNKRWSLSCTKEEWARFWRQVWSGWGLHHARLICWGILQHGFFTCARGVCWTVCQDICPQCQQSGKTISHLFFECPKIQHRWAMFEGLTWNSAMQPLVADSLFEMVNVAIRRQKHCPTKIILLTEVLHVT